MKTITLMISLLLLSCASAGSINDDQVTLRVINNSGGTVRIMVDDGFSYSLGRAWPGPTCFMPRMVSSVGIRFGIQHLGQREVWMQQSLINERGIGWILVINQPSQAVFDMISITTGDRCK